MKIRRWYGVKHVHRFLGSSLWSKGPSCRSSSRLSERFIGRAPLSSFIALSSVLFLPSTSLLQMLFLCSSMAAFLYNGQLFAASLNSITVTSRCPLLITCRPSTAICSPHPPPQPLSTTAALLPLSVASRLISTRSLLQILILSPLTSMTNSRSLCN
jgi:hypothetical protein